MLAVCMTEPHAGTDVANYRTNAVIKGDRVILNGTKTLISRAREAGMFVIFTRIDGKPGREGIGCVLLEPDTPGFEVTGTYHTMGGENLHEIQFNDCELPLENLVIRDDGFRKLLNAFNTQRCLNPSISLGLAEGAFEEARNYVRDRTVFGKPIGDYQGARWKLAEMYREIETARSILYRACITANPFPDPLMAAVAKITCNEMSNRVTVRGDPAARRIRFHRRISGLAPLSRRALRHARRRHLRDAARPDRQADHGRGGDGRGAAGV